MRGTTSPRRPYLSKGRRSLFRRCGYALVAVIVALGVATAWLFVWPPQGAPARADAIVMLQGDGDRLAAAQQLAREHRAAVLVISQGRDGYGGPCVPAMPGVKVICFDPGPPDTRGEAEFVGRLAQQDHWRSVIIVTTRAQDRRARILVGRCFAGSVSVSTAALPLSDWPFQMFYEWGALVKALVLHRAC
jgi:uncharacterized SAM-binding protein YcdF (DUF218 family)